MALQGNHVGYDTIGHTPQGMSSSNNTLNLPTFSSKLSDINAPNAWIGRKANVVPKDDNIETLINNINNSTSSFKSMRAPPKARYDNSIRYQFKHLSSKWVLENYSSLLFEIAAALPGESHYHLYEKIRKGYVDVPLHSTQEFQDFICKPIIHNNETVHCIKTRTSKDTSLWIHFADLPPSLDPRNVEASLVCGLQEYGKILEYIPHSRPGLPAKFGIPSASACIIPKEKYCKDVSLIPRMAVIGNHPEMFQVNPETARPHCTWCNSLGHLSPNCRSRQPSKTTVSNGNKRSYELRDAVVIVPTQWIPQDLWTFDKAFERYSQIKFSQAEFQGPLVNKVVPLSIGEPTAVIALSLDQRRNGSKRKTTEAPKVDIPKVQAEQYAITQKSSSKVKNSLLNKAKSNEHEKTKSLSGSKTQEKLPTISKSSIEDDNFIPVLTKDRSSKASVHTPASNVSLKNAFDTAHLSKIEAQIKGFEKDMHFDSESGSKLDNNMEDIDTSPNIDDPDPKRQNSSLFSFLNNLLTTPLSGGDTK